MSRNQNRCIKKKEKIRKFFLQCNDSTLVYECNSDTSTTLNVCNYVVECL